MFTRSSSSADASAQVVSVSQRARGAWNGEQSADNGGVGGSLWAVGFEVCDPVATRNDASMNGRVVSASRGESRSGFTLGGLGIDERSDGAENGVRVIAWVEAGRAAVGGTIAIPIGGRDDARWGRSIRNCE